MKHMIGDVQMSDQEERIRELENRIHVLESNSNQGRGCGRTVLWVILGFIIFLFSVGIIQFIAS
ncbi:hypothetical protein J2T13_003599 [Paenibacillus sp. DS2015]|uniref:hypothetical protein n=1 Tax=Paenibacillus sp. DS2015 TaxID=3373917 RepID=UPI003D1BEBD4